jgi:hypothetical protein
MAYFHLKISMKTRFLIRQPVTDSRQILNVMSRLNILIIR